MKKSSLIFSIFLTLLATVLWFSGSWWYYSCKIKNTCQSDQVLAATNVPSTHTHTDSNSDSHSHSETDDHTHEHTPTMVVDTDGDGLSDDEEKTLKTDPLLKDTDSDDIPDNEEIGVDISSPLDTDNDGIIDALDLDDDNDGLSTLIESKVGTSPLHADSDEDGITDIDEVGKNSSKPLDTDEDGNINALDPDDDDDGIDTANEIVFGTNPLLVDTDGDGLTDAQEIGDLMDTPVDADKDGVIDALDTDDNLDQDSDGLSDKLEAQLNTDPNKKDTDGDGIDDLEEIGSNTKAPLDHDLDGIIDALDTVDDSDSDNDSLTDDQEKKLGSNPNKADSDDDGINDAEEIGQNIDDPLDSDSDGLLNLIDEDDDNDTLSTQYEIKIGTNPLSSDSDNDGLSDAKELEMSKGDVLQDTDKDGLIDPVDTDDDNDSIATADEIKQGSDPLVANIKLAKVEDKTKSKETEIKTVAQKDDKTIDDVKSEDSASDKKEIIISKKTEDLLDSNTVAQNDKNNKVDTTEISNTSTIEPTENKLEETIVTKDESNERKPEIKLTGNGNTQSNEVTEVTTATQEEIKSQDMLIIESIKQDNDGNSFKASRIYFANDSDVLKDSRQITKFLTSVVDWLKLNSNNMVTLTGHTSNLGSHDKNLALGIRRVMGLREKLIEMGAPFQQIDFLSRGDTDPLTKNTGGKRELRNDRVDISPSIYN